MYLQLEPGLSIVAEVGIFKFSDIPQYLEDGTAGIAIIGENLLYEKQKKVEVVKKLGFAKCRVSLAVPKEVKEKLETI